MAGKRAEANYYGRLLLRELVKLRLKNGLMQADVCKKMKYNVSKLSRIEKGQVPDWHNVGALLDLYGVMLDEYPYYERLWELSQVKGWWRAFGIGNHGYIALEHEAQTIFQFHVNNLPGLLQTEGYIRRMIASASRPRSRKYIDRLIEIRKRRQERLTSANPLVYHVLIYESVLHHGCDKAQFLRLAEVAQLQNVAIQVVPSSGDLHDGLIYGSFDLFSFDDKEEPDIAYVEHRLGMAQTDDPEIVTAVRLSFQNIVKHALSPQASLDLIRGLMT